MRDPALPARSSRCGLERELTKRWIALRQTPERSKRIALVLANYPTRNARLANGVGLDTPASAVAILQWLQQEGTGWERAPSQPAVTS